MLETIGNNRIDSLMLDRKTVSKALDFDFDIDNALSEESLRGVYDKLKREHTEANLGTTMLTGSSTLAYRFKPFFQIASLLVTLDPSKKEKIAQGSKETKAFRALLNKDFSWQTIEAISAGKILYPNNNYSNIENELTRRMASINREHYTFDYAQSIIMFPQLRNKINNREQAAGYWHEKFQQESWWDDSIMLLASIRIVSPEYFEKIRLTSEDKEKILKSYQENKERSPIDYLRQTLYLAIITAQEVNFQNGTLKLISNVPSLKSDLNTAPIPERRRF